MKENRYKILDKAKKLKELADRGEDGEQNNAKVMLIKYMEKHNITDKELQGYDYKSSDYATMSDNDFLNELIKDSIGIGLTYLLSRFGSDDLKKKAKIETIDFMNKHGKVIVERVIKMQHKKHKP